MEVKVGIQHVSREIVVESTESASDVEKELMSSIGAGGDGVFTLTDERGRKVLIPCPRSPTSIWVRRTPGTSASARFDLLAPLARSFAGIRRSFCETKSVFRHLRRRSAREHRTWAARPLDARELVTQACRPSVAMRRVWFSTSRENIRLIAARSMPGRSTVPVKRWVRASLSAATR